jgi:hypothetical protein
MKLKILGLKNSIYQQKGIPGLHVSDGMMINNRPDSRTGIAKAVEVKQAMHREKKINMMADGYVLGEIKAKSMGIDGMD